VAQVLATWVALPQEVFCGRPRFGNALAWTDSAQAHRPVRCPELTRRSEGDLTFSRNETVAPILN